MDASKNEKQDFIGDDAVLDHFRKTCDPLAARQRVEHERIDDHCFGLMERADEILSQAMIDACFPSDAGIHLRHQRRRDLHIGMPRW